MFQERICKEWPTQLFDYRRVKGTNLTRWAGELRRESTDSKLPLFKGSIKFETRTLNLFSCRHSWNAVAPRLKTCRIQVVGHAPAHAPVHGAVAMVHSDLADCGQNHTPEQNNQ